MDQFSDQDLEMLSEFCTAIAGQGQIANEMRAKVGDMDIDPGVRDRIQSVISDKQPSLDREGIRAEQLRDRINDELARRAQLEVQMDADEDFREQARRFVRGELSKSERQRLTSPSNREKMERELVRVMQDIDVQIAERRAELDKLKMDLLNGNLSEPEWIEQRAEFDKWRAKSLRFQHFARQALDQIREGSVSHG